MRCQEGCPPQEEPVPSPPGRCLPSQPRVRGTRGSSASTTSLEPRDCPLPENPRRWERSPLTEDQDQPRQSVAFLVNPGIKKNQSQPRLCTASLVPQDGPTHPDCPPGITRTSPVRALPSRLTQGKGETRASRDYALPPWSPRANLYQGIPDPSPGSTSFPGLPGRD